MGSTLLEMRNYARVRADAVSSGFFSPTELTRYINVSLGELHDMLVQKFEDYYVDHIQFNLEPDKDKYSFEEIGIQGKFYKSLGVDVKDSGVPSRVPLFSFSERNRFADKSLSRGGLPNYHYRIQGDSISFIPKPEGAQEIMLWYVPSFKELVLDTDTVDSEIMSNWEEYAIINTVYKMKEKEELSTTVIERELEALRGRIDQAASNRDAGESFGITDNTIGFS